MDDLYSFAPTPVQADDVMADVIAAMGLDRLRHTWCQLRGASISASTCQQQASIDALVRPTPPAADEDCASDKKRRKVCHQYELDATSLFAGQAAMARDEDSDDETEKDDDEDRADALQDIAGVTRTQAPVSVSALLGEGQRKFEQQLTQDTPIGHVAVKVEPDFADAVSKPAMADLLGLCTTLPNHSEGAAADLTNAKPVEAVPVSNTHPNTAWLPSKPADERNTPAPRHSEDAPAEVATVVALGEICPPPTGAVRSCDKAVPVLRIPGVRPGAGVLDVEALVELAVADPHHGGYTTGAPIGSSSSSTEAATVVAATVVAATVVAASPATSSLVKEVSNLKRPVLKEASWQKVRAACDDAHVLLSTSPKPAVLKPCLSKLLKDTQLILNMSLGKHGEQRTPVSELRAAIKRLQNISGDLPAEGQAFVTQVTDGMLSHLGCVNTDKSYKPFVVVLNSMLELARMSS